jgi:hypothetical protein
MVRRREVLIGPDRRLRFAMELDRGRPRSWAVQLEWYDPEEERWVWVARYDTSGEPPTGTATASQPTSPWTYPRTQGRRPG